VDTRIKLQPPIAGVSDGTPRIDQPGQVTVPDGLRNVIPDDAGTGITRLATRAGLRSEYAGAQNTGAVQAIGEISRASGVSGTDIVNISTDTAGESLGASPIRGQAFVLETDGSIRNVFHDTRGTGFTSPPTGTGGHGGFYGCWDYSDPSVGYFATIARDSVASTPNAVIVGVNRFSLTTNAITHQTYALDNDAPYAAPSAGTADLFPNQLYCYGSYLFVAVNKYIYVFKASDLTYIARYSVPWAEEVQCLAGVTSNGDDFLLALCTGNYTIFSPTAISPCAVVADSGGGVTERFGEFYRTQIIKLRINYANTASRTVVAVGGTPLTHLYMPQGTSSTDAGYENHVTFRFSEWSVSRPRGCLAYSMAVEQLSDGTIAAFVARTNQGFGYDGNQSDQKPNGLSPYITACRVILTRGFEVGAPVTMSPTAAVRYGMGSDVGGWERDSGQSLRRAYTHNASTYQNDIPALSGGIRDPHTADNEPSLFAVAVDSANRRVFFGGRRPSLSGAGDTLYCFDADNGDLIWSIDTKGMIQQNALAVDPTNGNVLLGMIRTDGWEQTDGSISVAKAEMLTLNGGDGSLVRAFDLTDSINYNGFVSSSTTIGCFAVAVNSAGRPLVVLAPNRYDT